MKNFIVLISFLSVGLLSTMALAENDVVFSKTLTKSHLSSNAGLYGYYHSGSEAGIGVTEIQEPLGSPIGRPNIPNGPQPSNNFHTQLIVVPGLQFDETLGSHGAYVYNGVICSYRTFWTNKDTGLCSIGVAQTALQYTVKLVVHAPK